MTVEALGQGQAVSIGMLPSTNLMLSSSHSWENLWLEMTLLRANRLVFKDRNILKI